MDQITDKQKELNTAVVARIVDTFEELGWAYSPNFFDVLYCKDHLVDSGKCRSVVIPCKNRTKIVEGTLQIDNDTLKAFEKVGSTFPAGSTPIFTVLEGVRIPGPANIEWTIYYGSVTYRNPE